MSRELFFKDFQKTCQLFSHRNAYLQATQKGEVEGLTFQALCQQMEQVSAKLSEIVGRSSTYIGVEIQRGFALEVALLAIWRSENSPALVNQNTVKSKKIASPRYFLHDVSSEDGIPIGANLYLRDVGGEENVFPLDWDMCYLLFTSGSTGPPKPVQVPWSCIYPNVLELQEIFQLTQEDSILAMTPPTFDPFFVDLFLSLISGASLMDSSDPNLIKKASFLQTTPSLFRRLVQESLTSSTLRVLVLGGEKFPKWPLKQFAGVRVFNIYGVTEVSCWALLFEVVDSEFSQDDIPIGQPLKSIEIRIEPDGRLFLGSSSRKCLVGAEDPNTLSSVLFRDTGDIVAKQGENLIFKHRADCIIKRFGTKVDTNHIEKIITSLDICDDFAVIWEDDILSFFIVPDGCDSATEPRIMNTEEFWSFSQSVRTHLKDIEKPDVVIEIGKMPLNSHGKLDRMILKKISKDLMMRQQDQSETEVFKAAWCACLGVVELDVNKGFVSCGGTSIMAAIVLGKFVSPPPTLMAALLTDEPFEKCVALFGGEAKNAVILNDPDLIYSFEMLWKLDMGKCIDATPTLFDHDRDSRIAVGSHSSQISHLSCSTGDVVWTSYLGDRLEAGVCVARNCEKMFVGCYDHFMYCLCKKTGGILWKFRTGGMIKCTAKLSANEDYLYFGSYDGFLYSLRTQDGSLNKSLCIDDGGVLSSPLLHGDLLIVGTLGGAIVCVDQITFEEIWRRKLDSPVFSSPCFINERCDVVLVASVKGRVYCLSAANGAEIWTYECGGNIFSGLLPLPFEDNAVTFGCHDNHLYLLQPAAQPVLKWKLAVDSPIYATPCVVNRNIVCASTKGFVYVVDPRGFFLGRYRLAAEIFSSPVGLDDKVFFGCRDNNLYCLRLVDKDAIHEPPVKLLKQSL